MVQPGLFETRKYEAEFREFDAANPEVWRLFVKLTRQVIARGYRRYSADAVWQMIRWHFAVETTRPAGFKLNDHHRTYYARKFMAEHPQHQGFYETRERVA